MLAMIRFAQRATENPKLLIAAAVLLAFGLYMQYVLFAAPWGNPLPDPGDVGEASIHLRGLEGPAEAALPIAVYSQLHECLEGSEPMPHTGEGGSVGTLVVRRTDGTTYRVELHRRGSVRTEIGVFEPRGDEKCRKLKALMPKIKDYVTSVARL